MNRRSMLKRAAGMYSLAALGDAVEALATPYSRPKLKIADIRTAEVRVHGYQLHVRIYAEDGIFGQGEATDAAQGGVPLVNSWRPRLIGKDPLNVEAIFEQIRTSGIFAGAQGGQYITALSAIEIALWDLAGKAMGLPVYQLMGGKVRDRVRIYCDSDMRDPLADAAAQKIAFVKEHEFTAMKIDIDQATDPNRFDAVNWTANNAEIDRMIKWVQRTRDSIGMKIDLGVDMHGRYDAVTGKRVAKLVEPFRLMWLEEPVPPENIDAMRDIKQSTTTPICAGENIFLTHGFRELLDKRAVDIIMPDIQKCGGLLQGRFIAEMAHASYIPFAPHGVTSPIGMMASAHLCATVPNFYVLEWHWIDELDLWKNWVKEGEIIQKGFIAVSDKPGLGVEMNEEAARKAQVAGTPWFQAGRN
jgi:galactonate dehydratase